MRSWVVSDYDKPQTNCGSPLVLLVLIRLLLLFMFPLP
jgi:hypothetical protein